MLKKVLYVLTVVFCVSALWYLIVYRPMATDVGHSSTYIAFEFGSINEHRKCNDSVTPFLVVLITARPEESVARHAIRETWGNVGMFADIRILNIFLLGRSTDSALNEMVEQESRLFDDIMVGNFIDSYNNLTLKTMMGMRWVASFCPQAQYVMKTDSDMFVNMDYLIYKLLEPTAKPRRRYFVGMVFNSQPIRDLSNKWYMSGDLCPDSKYPPFCSGTGYVFSADVAGLICETSRNTMLYLGVCLSKLGIIPIHHSGFIPGRVAGSLCSYRRPEEAPEMLLNFSSLR